MLSMAASSRVWMFWRHWSLASRPRRPSASSSLSSSSDSRDRDGGGGGIDDTGGEQSEHAITVINCIYSTLSLTSNSQDRCQITVLNDTTLGEKKKRVVHVLGNAINFHTV